MKPGFVDTLQEITRIAFRQRNSIIPLVGIAFVLLLVAVAATNQSPVAQLTATPVPSGTTTLTPQTTATKTISPLVAEQNSYTNGIILGGVVLVLIILGGTLQVLRPRPNE